MGDLGPMGLFRPPRIKPGPVQCSQVQGRPVVPSHGPHKDPLISKHASGLPLDPESGLAWGGGGDKEE